LESLRFEQFAWQQRVESAVLTAAVAGAVVTEQTFAPEAEAV
jgi:hypothetical protein